MSKEVQLVAYDPQWPFLFALEARRIGQLLGGAPVEHVGSTAVPGMMAKPFIDMIAGIEEPGGLASVVSTLASSAYTYIPQLEADVPERRFFQRIDQSPGYFLHVVARSAPLWSDLRRFGDMLRSSPTLAREYLNVKLSLAESHAVDVDAYTVAKGPFILAALATAATPTHQVAD